MADCVVTPDEAILRRDLKRPEVEEGQVCGRWRIERVEWPQLFVWIAAAERPNGPAGFYFRLVCTGYPDRGPTAAVWDPVNQHPLRADQWPVGRARVAHVFRPDWEKGLSLYHPFDGLALDKHPEWPQKYPRKLWSRNYGVGVWLAEFHELLTCDEYEGVHK